MEVEVTSGFVCLFLPPPSFSMFVGQYPDGTALTMFLLLHSGDCLVGVYGGGEGCLLINMVSGSPKLD